jgi:hypothetical protein
MEFVMDIDKVQFRSVTISDTDTQAAIDLRQLRPACRYKSTMPVWPHDASSLPNGPDIIEL